MYTVLENDNHNLRRQPIAVMFRGVSNKIYLDHYMPKLTNLWTNGSEPQFEIFLTM